MPDKNNNKYINNSTPIRSEVFIKNIDITW